MIKIVVLLTSALLSTFGYIHTKNIETPSKKEMAEKSPAVSAEITYWPDSKEKALCFTWDDGHVEHTAALCKMFDSFGYKTTFFIDTDSLYSSNKSVYDYVLHSGHELGSHTVNHPRLTEIPLDSVDYECRRSAEDIMKVYGFKPLSFAHPYRAMSPAIDSIILKYYFTERFSTCLVFPDRLTHTILHTDTYESMKDEFETGLLDTDYRWIIYVGHGISAPYIKRPAYEPIDPTALKTFLNLVHSSYGDQVWVSSYENIIMYDYIRNHVTINYAAGKIMIDTTDIKDVISTYSHPDAYLTVKINNDSIKVTRGEGIIDVTASDGYTFVTLDIRRTDCIQYK